MDYDVTLRKNWKLKELSDSLWNFEALGYSVQALKEITQKLFQISLTP